MRKRKLVFGVLAVTVLITMLLGGLVRFSARLANLESVVRRLETDISESLMADVTFKHMEISFFPFPRFILHDSALSIGESIEVRIPSLTVYPRFLPLLAGEFHPAKIMIRQPEAILSLGSQDPAQPEDREPIDLKVLGERGAAAAEHILENSPGLTIMMQNGRLAVTADRATPIRIGNIDGRMAMHRSHLDISLQSRSDLWEQMALNGEIDAKDFRIRGILDLKKFRPQPLVDVLFADLPEKPGVTLSELSIRFETRRFNMVNGIVEGSNPYLIWPNHGKPLKINGSRLEGEFHLDQTKSTFTLRRLDLNQPRLRAGGSLKAGPLHRWKTSPARMEVHITDADVTSARKTLEVLADEIPWIPEVAGIVRDGKIPVFSLTASANEPGSLLSSQNLRIQSRIDNGKVHVPNADLPLDQVSGNVEIAGGYLTGSDLQAQYGDTRGTAGSLTIAIGEESPMVTVEIDVDADLAPLPPLLKKWVPDEAFGREMDRLSDVRGRASGRLVVQSNRKSFRTLVDVSAFNLSAVYGRLPHTLEIFGGRFSYEPESIIVNDLDGRLGNTTFQEVTAGVTWNREPYLAVYSATADIFPAQILPWLRSVEPSNPFWTREPQIGGIIHLSELELNGPFFQPGQWTLESHGSAMEMTLALTGLPGELEVPRARFHAKRDAAGAALNLREATAGLLDTSFDLSGTFSGDGEETARADIRFQGSLNRAVMQWLYTTFHLPNRLMVKTPLSVSDGRALWTKAGQTEVKGQFAVAGGPAGRLEITASPATFTIQELTLHDTESRASFRFGREIGRSRTEFSGYLTDRTLKALFIDYPRTEGWLLGDIRMEIVTDPATHITARGGLSAENLHVPLDGQGAVEICRISLEADGNRLDLREADFQWQEHHLALKGTIEKIREKWKANLTLQSDDLNVTELQKGWSRTGAAEQPGLFRRIADTALNGNIELVANRLTWEPLSWKQFQADLSFGEGTVDIAVAKGSICGVETPGVLHISAGQTTLDLTPSSDDEALDSAITCLRKGDVLATGQFDLTGDIKARTTSNDLAEHLRGPLVINARNGRIFRHIPLSRLLAYLNVIELFKYGIPGLATEGFPYHSMRIDGLMEGGKFRITEGIIDSPTMEIAFEGEFDWLRKTLDIDLLVAPLQTANYLIRKIPVVSQIMGGTLISIPLKMTGSPDDPKVTALPLKMVSRGLLGIIERTLKLPITLIEPMLPQN